MSSSYVDADVKCPFYHACDQKKLHITCEGISGAKANRAFFKNKRQLEDFLSCTLQKTETKGKVPVSKWPVSVHYM